MNELTIKITWSDNSESIHEPLKEFLTFESFVKWIIDNKYSSIEAVSGEVLMVENKLMYEWINVYFIAYYSGFTKTDIDAFIHFMTYMHDHPLSTKTNLMKLFLNVYQGEFTSKVAFAEHEAKRRDLYDLVNFVRYAKELFEYGYVMLGDGHVFVKF